jgi:hypothetical protein
VNGDTKASPGWRWGWALLWGWVKQAQGAHLSNATEWNADEWEEHEQ